MDWNMDRVLHLYYEKKSKITFLLQWYASLSSQYDIDSVSGINIGVLRLMELPNTIRDPFHVGSSPVSRLRNWP